MSCKIEYEKRVVKFLKKLAKSAPKEFFKIDTFLNEILPNCENPCILPNAKYLQGFNDNRYRWRLGDYRIIGIVKNDTFHFIQVIKISKRDENTYKGL
ncbi:MULTISPECIES: type II toxin-antitoxin system RelE family toxin [Campylobacter]|uniref:Type II toxin-antitoxin system RelE/ParE family toxin n=1 Tax=Campylobacter upsaliensis TaxID=28080 RepID=A0A381F3Q6_CAMUP|nr:MULTISPECIES: type II toxin-antitoxin system RelE/ParE family toxin [Campylobacter]MCR2101547.1 type II toxin-antitoxin system RelE/ParE family toxin [Campylobacter upsaliensis]SUX41195.1 Uncharacterised protein [Campylobacter upsaliensis]